MKQLKRQRICYSSDRGFRGHSGKGWERKEKRDVWPGIKHGARVHKRTDDRGGGLTSGDGQRLQGM